MRGWVSEENRSSTVYRFNPTTSATRAVFYIHGGSFTAPTSPAHFRFCRELAEALDAEIFIIEYEVAPKAKYPEIHMQCGATISEIASKGNNWSEIILAGDSAGAGIIPTIFSGLKPEVASIVIASILMSPWIDYEGSSVSTKTRERIDPWLNSHGINPVALKYFQNAEDIALAQASTRISLDDQPPTLISVGEQEILFSDSVDIFSTLLENGIWSSLYVGRSLWHVWPLFPIPERFDFIDEVINFVEFISSSESKLNTDDEEY
jgi:acetyl esterase/lipase